ncbi:MAG: hypothetical protein HZC40_00210 [Chloroflexi bacterium]|nr:hypothetical protein [Chloroflexota bacterium]
MAIRICSALSPSPAPSTVSIKWSTKREIKTAGYLIYRAENRAGPFLQITRERIPAINDPYLGGTYVYTDTETIAGITYYYQLEDVALDGTRTRQDPITVTARAASPTILGQPISEPTHLIIAGVFLLLGSTIWIARKSG